MANRNSNRRITNIKGDMNANNNNSNIGDNSIAISSDINNNNIRKDIQKQHNVNKNKVITPRRNKNKMTEEEKNPNPTFENGKYINKIDELFESLHLHPVIDNISFIRPNLKEIYESGNKSEFMIAKVGYMREDGRYSILNVCSEYAFLSDHLIVDNPMDQLCGLEGTLISFTGTVYKYGDKYSVKLNHIREHSIGRVKRVYDISEPINEVCVKNTISKIDKMSKGDRIILVRVLNERLNNLSLSMFGSSMFITTVLFDNYYLKTRNGRLSNDDYILDLEDNNFHFIVLLSTIIYQIQNGKIRNYQKLEKLIVQLVIHAQSTPTNKGDFSKENRNRLANFRSFCDIARIDMSYAADYVLSGIGSLQYKLNKRRLGIDEEYLTKLMVESVTRVFPTLKVK